MRAERPNWRLGVGWRKGNAMGGTAKDLPCLKRDERLVC